MLKLMVLKKRHKKMLEEATQLRAKQAGFATREAELAAQVEAASTDEEIAAAAAAVAELEEAQKTTGERLDTIIAEAEAIQDEIAAAEAAAAAAGAGDGVGSDDGTRSRRSVTPEFLRRCQAFLRTGRMVYEDARSMVRAAVLTSTNGVVGPTAVGGINDSADSAVSDFLDLITITDCTGMSSYKVAYMIDDSEAGDGKEGQVPTESEPTFGYVELKPGQVDLISYISREIRKQSPLQYEEKVKTSATRALRRKLSKKAVDAVIASDLNTTHTVTGATGAALFTPSLLSEIILAYGGDEGVDGAAVLTLSKADLKAFATVRGKNEYLPVYSITPDTANPSMGVIKDNNGLSCRYCLNKNVPSLSTAQLTAEGVKGMFYGNPKCAEMAMWGGVEVIVNDGYKFGEGLLTIRGETTADADVTVYHGFVQVVGKTA